MKVKGAGKTARVLYFITGNTHKFNEAKKILSGSNIALEQVNIPVPELQGNAVEISMEKAGYAAHVLKKTVFVEDTCLECAALKGLPGPYIKYFEEALGAKGLYQMLAGFKDKRASAVTRIAYAEPEKRPLVFEGRVQGTIVSPRGTSGFGFDPIFLPQGKKQTFAQMGVEEKNKISHRKSALEEFKKFLAKKP